MLGQVMSDLSREIFVRRADHLRNRGTKLTQGKWSNPILCWHHVFSCLFFQKRENCIEKYTGEKSEIIFLISRKGQNQRLAKKLVFHFFAFQFSGVKRETDFPFQHNKTRNKHLKILFRRDETRNTFCSKICFEPMKQLDFNCFHTYFDSDFRSSLLNEETVFLWFCFWINFCETRNVWETCFEPMKQLEFFIRWLKSSKQ